MRIASVNEMEIVFDNGCAISYDHNPDCCEVNYADFSILNPNVVNYDYDFPTDLQFKPVEGMGFKFGCEGHWIFIPCYSEQNGYYSDKVEILFDDKVVIHNLECQFVSDWD
jgi:hypothetical protein